MPKSTEHVSPPVEPESQPEGQPGIRVALHSKRPLGAGFQRLIEQRVLGTLFGFGLGSRVERSTVRFEDLNGPKGGVDTSCRILLVVKGQRSLVVEARAEDPARAFRAALPKLVAALERQVKRRAAKPRVSLRTTFELAS